MQEYDRGDRKVVIAARVNGKVAAELRKRARLEQKSVSQLVSEALSALVDDQ
jgi:predicted HicB family RNase H-like nuclease